MLLENDGPHEFGCVMLYFNFPQIFKLQDAINPSDISEEEGLENEPHITLLYGLHEGVTNEEIKNILDKFTYSKCKVFNPSLFKNEKYDVLKYDVEGKNLHETNKELKQFPFTDNFPKYHPHMTIGYLKPGKGQKYVEAFSKTNDFELMPTHAIFSQPDGTKNKIKIKIENAY